MLRTGRLTEEHVREKNEGRAQSRHPAPMGDAEMAREVRMIA